MKKRLFTALVFAIIVGLVVAAQEVSVVPEGLIYVALAGAFGFLIAGAQGKGKRETAPWRNEPWNDCNVEDRGDGEDDSDND